MIVKKRMTLKVMLNEVRMRRLMLANYIFHIINKDNCCRLLEKTQQQDNLTQVMALIQTWLFNDGVIVKCTEEIEIEHYDNDAQCPEHWITWEIVESKSQLISPYKKEFFNLCQQRFWLKMQHANNQKN